MHKQQQKPGRGVAPVPRYLLPRELLSEVANWVILPTRGNTDHASRVTAVELQPPVSGVYDSYVCSRLERMPPVNFE